jgi:hypothetical protein
MKIEELKSKIAKLESKMVEDKNKLLRNFIDVNNPYKIGDIITDHIGSIKFDELRYSWGGFSSKPTAVYHGLEIRKDGVPKKNGNRRGVYGSNILQKA